MSYEHSIAGKWVGLLKEMAPRLDRVPESAPWAPFYVRSAQDAGERLGLKITAAGVRNVAEIEPAIASMAADGGLVVLPATSGTVKSATLVALVAKHRVPAIYSNRFFTADGGLMSYGTDQRAQARAGATYIDRILRSAKPAELPVQFAAKFELAINVKAAKAIGIEVPPSLLAIADELID
jgi:putative tryptophan/tyrosine transport system substrate-binding protein